MRLTTCPAPAELTAFRSGAFTGPELLRLAEHLAGCPACCRRLAELPVAGYAAEVRIHPDNAGSPIPDTAVDAPALPAAIGPYRVVRVLGRGGMGVVYEAVHADLGSRAAVKVLARPETDPDARARFRKEWLAVGRLDHPNVVRGLSAGHAGGVAYLAMELVDGPDAGRLVRQLGPLAPADAAAVAAQAARGLAHAHALRVVHRDVKPSNLLLARDGTVKLLDLGLAQVAGTPGCSSARLTRHTYLGTADYMAPEQWDDPAAVGPPADVYALGCVLYQLLTGRPPFAAPDHASPRAKMLAHQDVPPPDPRADRPDLPWELVDLLSQMLAKRPDDRPAAAAVADALAPLAAAARLDRLAEVMRGRPDGGFADGPPTAPLPAASTAELPRPAPRRKSRTRRLVAGAAAVVAVGVVVAAVAGGRPGRGAGGTPAPRPGAEPNVVATFEGFRHPLVGAALSPDGATAFTAELDGTVRRWDVASRSGVQLFDPKNPDVTWQLRGLHLAPTGDALAVFSSKKVTVLAPASGRVRQTVRTTRNIASVALSADGKWLAVGHYTAPSPKNPDSDLAVTVWDLATGERAAFWTTPVGGRVAVVFGPGDRTVLAVDAAGRTAVLDLTRHAAAVPWSGGRPGEALVALAAFSGGRVVAVLERTDPGPTATRRLVYRHLDPETGQAAGEQVGPAHAAGPATAAGVGAGGRVAVAGTSAGRLLVAGRGPLAAHPGKVACVGVSADGRRLISAGTDDRIVKVWSLPAPDRRNDE